MIPSVGALRGGPSSMVHNLARSLSREGLETHVATTDDNGFGTLSVPYGVPVRDGGVTYWYFKRQTRLYTVSWPLSQWLARSIPDFDVLHIHALFSYATLPAAFWARRHGVPYIVRPLGTLNEWGMTTRRPWLKQLSFNLIERRILANAALVHYTSDQERVEAERLSVRGASTVIPNALPERTSSGMSERFRSRYPQLRGRRIILFLSRIDRKKGLDLLLRAFAEVRACVPDVSLVVAGVGETRLIAALQDDARRLGISDDVIWAGFLQGGEKEAAFADADVYALPSYSENFGIAAAEAMAAGLPLVVSDQVGIHPDISMARAGLVVPCEAGRLAAALRRVLADRGLGRTMGENGRAFARDHYSSDAVTRQVIRIYNQVAH